MNPARRMFAAALVLLLPLLPAAPGGLPLPHGIDAPVEHQRGRLLTSLYVSFAAAQALDVHSTVRALDRGGSEANPAMRGLAGNRAAFIAVKAGTAVSTIWISEKLRKRHPRAARALMIGLNVVVAAVVAHNYSSSRERPSRGPSRLQSQEGKNPAGCGSHKMSRRR